MNDKECVYCVSVLRRSCRRRRPLSLSHSLSLSLSPLPPPSDSFTRRSTPDQTHSIVEAAHVPPPLLLFLLPLPPPSSP
jgi:hypothetical protein